MPYLQPTVRQLQPLGRRHHSAPVLPEEVGAHARAADPVSPDAKTTPRRRWRRRLAARATLSA
jgi:hypothetical protein